MVYCAIPSLTAPLKAAKYCEKNRVNFIIDIQDIWLEAFRLVLNVPILRELMLHPLRLMADEVYRSADDICAVSRSYAAIAMKVNKQCVKPHIVYLGTSLSTFDTNVLNNPVEKPREELWLDYCGSLGKSYDIAVTIEALSELNHNKVMAPKLIVMGDGENRLKLENLAAELKVNAIFTGRLQYHQMCGMLAACDIAVNPIVGGAFQSIINKHADYAAAGIPVLNTQESDEYRELVDRYSMRFYCNNSDAVSLTKNIQILMEDD